MTWRSCPFVEGAVYAVLQDFVGAFDQFQEGERVRFERADYSRYDGATIYRFSGEVGGQTKQWWHYDSQPDELWKAYFNAGN